MNALNRRWLAALLAVCVGFGLVARFAWTRREIARVEVAMAKLSEVRCRAFPRVTNVFPEGWRPTLAKLGIPSRWGEVRGTSIARIEVNRHTDVTAAADILRQADVAVDHVRFPQHDDYRGSREDIERLFEAASFRGLCYRREKLPTTSLPFLRQEGVFWVDVAHTNFSDVAIADLPRSTEYLDLTRTRVTDEGLAALENLSKLRKLIVKRTAMSREAVDAFRARHPDCLVSWSRLTTLR